VTSEIHGLMQDADDENALIQQQIKDDVGLLSVAPEAFS